MYMPLPLYNHTCTCFPDQLPLSTSTPWKNSLSAFSLYLFLIGSLWTYLGCASLGSKNQYTHSKIIYLCNPGAESTKSLTSSICHIWVCIWLITGTQLWSFLTQWYGTSNFCTDSRIASNYDVLIHPTWLWMSMLLVCGCMNTVIYCVLNYKIMCRYSYYSLFWPCNCACAIWHFCTLNKVCMKVHGGSTGQDRMTSRPHYTAASALETC